MLQPDRLAIDNQIARQLLPLIDLTRLNEEDTPANLKTFFKQAEGRNWHVTSVCIMPQFVRLAKLHFHHSLVKICTVANFPTGDEPLKDILINIHSALEEGANEIDVVLPYKRYLAGDKQYARTFIKSCKELCGAKVILKVILETGLLGDTTHIADASKDAIVSGADFIKTSTGKIPQGVTLDAATTMLYTIKQLAPTCAHPVGLKISGGVREVSQAMQYVSLAKQIMGEHWVTPKTFRIGASQLVTHLLEHLHA